MTTCILHPEEVYHKVFTSLQEAFAGPRRMIRFRHVYSNDISFVTVGGNPGMALIEIHIPQPEFHTVIEDSTVIVRNQLGPLVPAEDAMAEITFGQQSQLGAELCKRLWLLIIHGKVKGITCTTEEELLEGNPHVKMTVEYPEA